MVAAEDGGRTAVGGALFRHPPKPLDPLPTLKRCVGGELKGCPGSGLVHSEWKKCVKHRFDAPPELQNIYRLDFFYLI